MHLLEVRCQKFGSLKKYREALNRVQSLPYFIADAATELIEMADRLDGAHVQTRGDERGLVVPITISEEMRLRRLAKETKRHMLAFFNSTDSVKIRLVVVFESFSSFKKLTPVFLCSI